MKPVHELIDCTELNVENGKAMLQTFSKEEVKKSLLEDFP